MSQLRILITGASSGIGQATALHLARKGHQVYMLARREDKLKAIAAESPAVVGEFIVAGVDVSKPESIRQFVESNREWLGKIDVLVNNAGLALGRESLQESSSEDLRQMVDTNVLGLLEMTRAVVPFMVKRGAGHIINLGSVAGETAYSGGTVYCATKAAVHMATDALRLDLVGTGIRVSTVAPGRVATDFSKVRFKGDEEKAKKVYEGFRPLTSEDIAETIAWVIERPAHVNIQDLTILSTDQPNATQVVPVGKR